MSNLVGIWYFNVTCFNAPVLLNYDKVSVGINNNLTNSMSYIHPLILYIFINLNAHTIFFYKGVSFLKKKNIFFNYTAIILTALLLGSFWSCQELLWGGFWNWDVVEIVLLNFALLCLNYQHSKKNYLRALYKVGLLKINYVIYIFFNKSSVFLSQHSFSSSFFFHIHFSYIYAALLIQLVYVWKFVAFRQMYLYYNMYIKYFVYISITYVIYNRYFIYSQYRIFYKIAMAHLFILKNQSQLVTHNLDFVSIQIVAHAFHKVNLRFWLQTRHFAYVVIVLVVILFHVCFYYKYTTVVASSSLPKTTKLCAIYKNPHTLKIGNFTIYNFSVFIKKVTTLFFCNVSGTTYLYLYNIGYYNILLTMAAITLV